MENCNHESKIDNVSYRRIRDIVCQSIEPYHEKERKINSNYTIYFIFIILMFFILMFNFFNYTMLATNLFK